jgi:hypothetical protein
MRQSLGKTMLRFGVSIYWVDGEPSLWFKDNDAGETIKEFIEWKNSINGSFLSPRIKKARLYDIFAGVVILDLTDIIAV